MLALGTASVLVEWTKAHLGCGRVIGRIQNEDLNVGRFGCFPLRWQFEAFPAPPTSEEPSATDAGFGDFMGCKNPKMLITQRCKKLKMRET